MNTDILKGIAYTIGALSFAIVCQQIKDNGIHSLLACNEKPQVRSTRSIPAIPSMPESIENLSYNTQAMTDLVEALPPLPVDQQAKIYKRGK